MKLWWMKKNKGPSDIAVRQRAEADQLHAVAEEQVARAQGLNKSLREIRSNNHIVAAVIGAGRSR